MDGVVDEADEVQCLLVADMAASYLTKAVRAVPRQKDKGFINGLVRSMLLSILVDNRTGRQA